MSLNVPGTRKQLLHLFYIGSPIFLVERGCGGQDVISATATGIRLKTRKFRNPFRGTQKTSLLWGTTSFPGYIIWALSAKTLLFVQLEYIPLLPFSLKFKFVNFRHQIPIQSFDIKWLK